MIRLWVSETYSFDISGQEFSSSELECVPVSPPSKVPGILGICPMLMEVSESKTTTLSPSGGMGVSQPSVVVLYSMNYTKNNRLTVKKKKKKSAYTYFCAK